MTPMNILMYVSSCELDAFDKMVRVSLSRQKTDPPTPSAALAIRVPLDEAPEWPLGKLFAVSVSEA